MDGEVSQNSLLASWVWEDATSFGSANLQDNECWSMIFALIYLALLRSRLVILEISPSVQCL